MKKIYKLRNLHCADCARSLQETIQNFENVQYASINFVTEKFEIEIEDVKFEETMIKVRKLISDFSKKVVLQEDSAQKIETDRETNKLCFKIRGCKCPKCAKKITDALKRLKEVSDATIDQSNRKLFVSINVSEDVKTTSKIVSLIKNIEPNIKLKQVKDKGIRHKIQLKTIAYVVGLMLGIVVVTSLYDILHLQTWLYYVLLIMSAILLGYSTYITAIKMLLNKNINENLLLTISVFGAIAIGEHIEGLMVVALYTLGKILEGKAVDKSRRDIRKLMDIQPEFATVLAGGIETRVNPAMVEIGSKIVVKPGERVAIDGKIIDGSATIDTKSITGESTPYFKTKGDEVLSGFFVVDGLLVIETTKAYTDSTVTKILGLIESASDKKSKTETFISKFSKYYTLIVVMLSITVGLITGLILKDISEAVYRALVFLVISCPCAFAISVPLSYFSGIGNASKKGILVKGSNYLDACTQAKVIAFDKTGTLTTGELVISEIKMLEDAFTKDEILKIAAIGEQGSNHPIAKAIMRANNEEQLPKPEAFREIAGEGVYFEYDGTEYFIGKRVGKEESLTHMVVKKGNIDLAEITFKDSLKTQSEETCKKLKKMGLKTVMLSGDSKQVAMEVGQKLGMEEIRYELLPQEKFKYIEDEIKSLNNKGRLIYVGDGMNDAPSLALADVGVSMGINGSPASIEASDVVIVDDNPEKTIELIKSAKHTRKIVLQNIIFAASVKIICLVLGTLGIAKMFLAVFADVGVTLLAVLNSLRALNYGLKEKKYNKKSKE